MSEEHADWAEKVAKFFESAGEKLDEVIREREEKRAAESAYPSPLDELREIYKMLEIQSPEHGDAATVVRDLLRAQDRLETRVAILAQDVEQGDRDLDEACAKIKTLESQYGYAMHCNDALRSEFKHGLFLAYGSFSGDWVGVAASRVPVVGEKVTFKRSAKSEPVTLVVSSVHWEFAHYGSVGQPIVSLYDPDAEPIEKLPLGELPDFSK